MRFIVEILVMTIILMQARNIDQAARVRWDKVFLPSNTDDSSTAADPPSPDSKVRALFAFMKRLLPTAYHCDLDDRHVAKCWNRAALQ